MMDYYCERPSELEQLCLMEFLQWYEIAQPTRTGRGAERLHIVKYNKLIKKRGKAAVVRTPRFPLNSVDYYYSILFLTVPHRTEIQIVVPYANAKEAFLAKSQSLQTRKFGFLSD